MYGCLRIWLRLGVRHGRVDWEKMCCCCVLKHGRGWWCRVGLAVQLVERRRGYWAVNISSFLTNKWSLHWRDCLVSLTRMEIKGKYAFQHCLYLIFGVIILCHAVWFSEIKTYHQVHLLGKAWRWKKASWVSAAAHRGCGIVFSSRAYKHLNLERFSRRH